MGEGGQTGGGGGDREKGGKLTDGGEGETETKLVS